MSSLPTFNPGAEVNTQGLGNVPLGSLGVIPYISLVAPASTNIKGPYGMWSVGQRWINQSTNAEYVLTSYSVSNASVTANWTELGAAAGDILTLTGDSGGAISPSAGNITLAGTADQVTSTGSGSTITFSLIGPYTPATYTAHGVLVGAGTSSIAALTVGTTGQVLIGATGANPAFGSLGVNSGLTAHGVLLGEGNSAIAAAAVESNGQVLLGSTGADPAFATLTTSTGVAFTTGAASLAINVKSGGFAVATVAGASQALAVQTTYVLNDATQTSLTLPTTSAVGDVINIIGSSLNTGGWAITYTTNQIIWGPSGHSTLTSGACTSASAAAQTLTLVCTVANTIWVETAFNAAPTLS